MPDQTSHTALLWAGGLVAALGLGLVLLTSGAGDRQLDRSALGVQGLVELAPDLGLTLELPRRIAARKASAYSLRILPLYDLNLDTTEATPTTRAEQLGQRTLRELTWDVFDQKTAALPTLVVLPKWTGGVILTGVALPDFLIRPAGFATLLEQIGLYDIPVLHPTPGFATEPVTLAGTTAQVALFYPQVLNRAQMPKTCTERAGLRAGALLIDCTATDDLPAITILTDPDILNTHGITLGQNAAFARAALRQKDSRPIYLDTSTDLLLAPEADAQAQHYTRDSATLLRFFAWPLSLLWLAGAMVFGVTLWRGLVRFGPVRNLPEDRLEISKRAAITARARLMRMSRNDAPMVAEFVQTRLQALADQTFGKGTGTDRLYAKFARTNPAQAKDLQRLAAELTGPTPPDLRAALTQFHDLLERLTHAT